MKTTTRAGASRVHWRVLAGSLLACFTLAGAFATPLMAQADDVPAVAPQENVAQAAHSDAAEMQFAQALAAMDQGDYERAKTIYHSFVDRRVANGDLYYNLGICSARLGHQGEAIAAFLEARRLRPRDPDVKANLSFLLQRIPDRLEAVDKTSFAARMTSWLAVFTPKEYAWTSTLCAALWGLALAAVVWRTPAGRRPWRLLTTFALVPLLLAACAWTSSRAAASWGAVIAHKTPVRAGPGDANTLVFELGEGAPLRYDGAGAQGWLRVALSDGKKGWVYGKDVKMFGVTLR